MAVPKWFFALSGLILVVVGLGLIAVRERPKYERGLARYLNLGSLWAATVILTGLAFVALGLGIVPWPRWR
jgi:hypothetical protein